MNIVGASFLMLAYFSAVSAIYYHTGGNLAMTFYTSAATAGVISLLLFWKGN